MAGFILRDWQPGDVVTAEGFSQLVAAVRGLLAGCGVQPGRRYAARRWRFFAPAGAAVLWRDAAGEPRAWMNDVLWQVGPFVKVLPGGEVADLKKAMGKAAGEAAVGLHADLEVVEHGDMEGWTLEAAGVEYAAAAWVPPVVNDDGSVEMEVHGEVCGGCQLTVGDVFGRWQAWLRMWPMPQGPSVVWRGVVNPAVEGSSALLPGGEEYQVLASQGGVYYVSPIEFHGVLYEWRGCLDRWGQLRFSTGVVELADFE